MLNRLWVNLLEPIDDKWFDKAVHINNARNKAAHSYDSEDIYKVFGKKGENAFTMTKNECIYTLKQLLHIEKKSKII